ncbi:MAG: hypothetical protein LUO79_00280 [Methanomassiliicoccales archaeon]|nr:hypothetical protein [Methanomassiliicoccales archaeon]
MRLDRRGIEGMPLKLLLTSLLISLTLPTVLGSLQGYDRATKVEELKVAVQKIRSAALSAYLAGPGNVRTVPIDLDLGGKSQASITLGGRPGTSNSTVIRYFLQGSEMGSVFLLEPKVSIVPEDGESLKIDGSITNLRLECVYNGGATYVSAGVVAC